MYKCLDMNLLIYLNKKSICIHIYQIIYIYIYIEKGKLILRNDSQLTHYCLIIEQGTAICFCLKAALPMCSQLKFSVLPVTKGPPFYLFIF